jgi:hypothetical protein
MRLTMKPKQGDRSVTFEDEWGSSVRVRAWDNAGVLTIEVTFDKDAAVAVEVNGREVHSYE